MNLIHGSGDEILVHQEGTITGITRKINLYQSKQCTSDDDLKVFSRNIVPITSQGGNNISN